MNEAKRMIIISLDAVGGMDEAYLRTLPNFRAFMDGAAICNNVKKCLSEYYLSGAYVDCNRTLPPKSRGYQ